jgi:uncharacterized protein YecE (DUF72 family)
MRVYTGTSGFSYKEWKGGFYPEKTKPSDMLSYYAKRLSTVEINNTFYRLPRASVLESWRAQVGPDFRFVIKASRRITHFKRLKPEALDETKYLVETTSVLGSAFGVLLMQLPPNLPADLDRLSTYLCGVPDGVRMAFEFRHASWLSTDTLEVLRDHGHALCFADAEDEFEVPLTKTADWGYLRLRRPNYDGDALDNWEQTIREMNWNEVFVFFKHEDAAAGPLMAESFAKRFQQV